MNELLIGAITGILFGFIMQKAQVIRYDKQVAALRLQDMTIVKFMLTTILVAMVGIYLLFDLGLIKLSLKPLILGGNVLGGLIFGIGWGILGYCPATATGCSAGQSGIGGGTSAWISRRASFRARKRSCRRYSGRRTICRSG